MIRNIGRGLLYGFGIGALQMAVLFTLTNWFVPLDQALRFHSYFLDLEACWFLYAFVRIIIGVVGIFFKRASAPSNIAFGVGAILVLAFTPIH